MKTSAMTKKRMDKSLNSSRSRRALGFAFALAMLLGACSTIDDYREAFPEPDDRLDHMLALYHYNRSLGHSCAEVARPSSSVLDCGRILNELERLHSDFPDHARTMMTIAVLSYEVNRKDRAQLLLDQLLELNGPHPEAAILRARIAVEEGNRALADEVLMRQILLSPGNAELRSTLASVYYVSGDIPRARNILNVNGVDYREPWKLAYHNGLLAEAEKHWVQACALYLQALGFKPNYGPALSRVIALAEQITCKESESVASSSTSAATSFPATERTSVSAVSEEVVAESKPEPITLPLPATVDRNLFGIAVEELSADSVQIRLSTSTPIPDLLVIQMSNPPRLLVELPLTTSSLEWVANQYEQNILASVSTEQTEGTLRLTFALRAEINLQVENTLSEINLLLKSNH